MLSRLKNTLGLLTATFACILLSTVVSRADELLPKFFASPGISVVSGIKNLQDTIAKLEESKDIQRMKILRASIVVAITDLDLRIARIDSARTRSVRQANGIGESLLSSLANSFRDRKLTWLKDTRYFLVNERDHLDALITGVTKATIFTSSRLEAAKVKIVSKLRGLF